MRTEDCKWGHCYACGVPGNGEDTVLARASLGGSSVPEGERGEGRGANAAVAPLPLSHSPPLSHRGLPRGRQGRGLPAEGDAGPGARRSHPRHAGGPGLPPPRDLLEDGRRALSLAPQHDGRPRARDPRRGPARALLGGIQPAHEALDGPGAAAGPREPPRGLRRRGQRAVRRRQPPARSTRSCRRASTCSKSARSSAGEPALSKAVKAARYAVRLDSAEQIGRAAEALANGWREADAGRQGSLARDRPGGPRAAPLRGQPRPVRRRDDDAEEGPGGAPRDPAGRPGRPLGHARGDGPRLMSYRVTVTARFEAAHNLIDYEGGPEPLHGHSYRVEAVLESREAPAATTWPWTSCPPGRPSRPSRSELDYRYINEHPDFSGRNTSAENLARWFAEKLEGSGRPRLVQRRRGHRLGRPREPRDVPTVAPHSVTDAAAPPAGGSP